MLEYETWGALLGARSARLGGASTDWSWCWREVVARVTRRVSSPYAVEERVAVAAGGSLALQALAGPQAAGAAACAAPETGGRSGLCRQPLEHGPYQPAVGDSAA